MPEGPQPYRGARRKRNADAIKPRPISLPQSPYLREHMPSGCRNASLAFPRHHGGVNVTSSPAATHSLCTGTTSSTHTDIQHLCRPLVPIHLKCSRVRSFCPGPLAAPWQRNIWTSSPEYTAPKPRRRFPTIPSLLQPPLLTPRKTRRNIGHIQYRSNPFAFIARKAYHRSRQIKLPHALPKVILRQ